MKVLVTGGTGFLGSRLIESLLRQGHQVIAITRKPMSEWPTGRQPVRWVRWPIENTSEEDLLLDCEALIHLAGESIAGAPWTPERKALIRNSRVGFTTQLLDFLRRSTRLHTVLSSSAIGFYGHRKTEVLTEASPNGEGFLAEVCKAWESAAKTLKRPGLRTVLLRTGVVLGRGGGFLGEMEPLYKMWLGGPVGEGKQTISWIHINDWLRAVLFCLETPAVEGPVNLVAPEPVTNASFSALYAELFKQPVKVPAPAFAVKWLMGEMSALALESQNVRPFALLRAGFHFHFSYLREALHDIYEFETQKGRVSEYFNTSTWLPASAQDIFRFFADEKNIEVMTPPTWRLEVVKKSTAEMMAGTLIDYKLKVHGLPLKWRAKIERWEPPKTFVDTQPQGPYGYWHHTHEFEPLAGGTLIKDRIHYRLPLSGAGRLVGAGKVKKDLEALFAYREKILREKFSS